MWSPSPKNTTTHIQNLQSQLEDLKAQLAHLQRKYEDLEASTRKEKLERESKEESVKAKMDGEGKGGKWDDDWDEPSRPM